MSNLFELYLGSLNIKGRIGRFFYHRPFSSIDSERKYRCDFRIKICHILICKKVLIDSIGLFLMAIYRTVDALCYRVTLSLRYLAGSNVTMRDGRRYMSIL